ncbi:MAG TPA: phage tail protein [Candidatus Gemmiger faecavium]|nr:phage tail protein [Candidatus Gemmiger faecavium]
MQTFNLDISTPSGPLVIYAKQADSMSRFFKVVLSDSGAPWEPPAGIALTVRFGAAGMPAGWYDTITEPDGGTHSAFSINENVVTVEIAEQAVSSPGKNTLCLLINGAEGYQLASWNFELNIQAVPGLLAPEADVYYNALTEQVAKTLQNVQDAQAAAAAAAQSAQDADASAASINPDNLLTKTEYGGSAAGIVKKADTATNATKSTNAETARSANVAQDSELLATHSPEWYAPPGMIVPYAGAAAPAGWLLCDGSAVSRTTYADLFAVIGTTYGAGNGSTTFTLPDLRGRVAAGANASNALASRAGADSKQIARANLPAEKLNLEDNGTWIVDSTQTGSESGKTLQMGTRSGAARLDTNTLGSGTAFDVRQATMYVHYIIKC